MIRILFVLGILGLSAVAHADAPSLILTTVDEVQRNGSQLTVTGIVSGQATATTTTFGTLTTSTGLNFNGDACERAGLMMMSRPGRFQLQLWNLGSATWCRLVRQTQ